MLISVTTIICHLYYILNKDGRNQFEMPHSNQSACGLLLLKEKIYYLPTLIDSTYDILKVSLNR